MIGKKNGFIKNYDTLVKGFAVVWSSSYSIGLQNKPMLS